MRVILTDHAELRLGQYRQKGLDINDVIDAAKSIPGKAYKTAFKFRNLVNKNGKFYHLVIKDRGKNRVVITIIGK